MKNKILFGVILVALLIGLTACSEVKAVSASGKPCSLSSIQIKNVEIKGDDAQMWGTALRSELYKYGASATYRGGSTGQDIVGSLELNGIGEPYILRVDIPGTHFASVVRSPNPISPANVSMPYIVKEVAKDFCLATDLPAKPK